MIIKNRYDGKTIREIDNLRVADLQDANLRGANLYGANLQDANLRGADLYGANLYGANLQGANLQSANLQSANLQSANLQSANLQSANLQSADLTGANLYGADLPDGRTLSEYIAWLPQGLLTQGGKQLSDVIAAWDRHTWTDCPMATAFGAGSLAGVPECYRQAAALFVALFDGGHLPRPEVTQ